MSSIRLLSLKFKIYIFESAHSYLFTFDVDKEKWSKEILEATEKFKFYAFVEKPSFSQVK